LEVFFKPWQVWALKALRDHPEGATSAIVWRQVLEKTKISRASVINFLEEMSEAGFFERWERTGKGGHRGVYRLSLSETQRIEYLAQVILQKLLQEFPNETRNTIKTLRLTPKVGESIRTETTS